MSQTEKKQSTPEPYAIAPITAEVQQALDALKPFRLVPVDLSIELGKVKLKIRDLLGLRYHSTFELDKNAGSQLNLYINGVLLGKGEPVVLEDKVGIKVDEIAKTET